MSAIIWCDFHKGPFSENETGWAYLEVHIRKNRQGEILRETRHSCAKCTKRILEVEELNMIESAPKDDGSDE